MGGVDAATNGIAVSSAAAAAIGRFRRSAAPFIGPLMVLIVLGFNIPILLIFNYSISGPHGFTLVAYQDILTTPVFLKVVGNTFRITIITTAVVATLGYVLAYWITGLTPRLRNAALAMVVLSFWVSVLVRTYAWIVVLGNAGLVNRFLQWSGLRDAPIAFLYNDLGVIIGMANIQLPLLVLPLYAAMTRIDPRHMQAAASLGASDRVIFWKVFFPQTVPALLSGIMLVVILCLGFYVTPAILGGGRVPMVANMLDTYINSIPKWELASAVAMVLLIFTLILFGIYRRLDARAGGEP
jgi:ABC-type spermidine/putrescine transport system permease subunit I